MKRVLAVVFALLVVVQLCLLPIAVTAVQCPVVPVVTLPATNITDSTATLNGSVVMPARRLTLPEGITLTSLQYVGSYWQMSVSFEYGTVPGVYTGTQEIEATGSFLANISGLSPCTTYYARAKVHNVYINTKFNQYGDGLKGAGVGLDYTDLQYLFSNVINGQCYDYGSVISFQTTGCQTFIGTGTQSSSAGGGTGPMSNGPPVTNSIITTQSASLSAKAVTPGTPVIVTADIINKSAVNGSKKVTLYVNGQVETTQGITVNSGGSTKLTFNVSRSEPGDYAVYVDGVPAGSFKVELFRESDGILILSAVLVALAFLIGMVMLWHRQRAVPN